MLKIFKTITVIIMFTFSSQLLAQHLYYSDGSIFPLSVSNSQVSVKFRNNVSVSLQTNCMQDFSQIDPGREKRVLPNNFIGIPLKANVNVSQFMQTLKNSNLFEAVFPAYSTAEQDNILMFDEFLVRFKPTVSSQVIEVFAFRHGVEIVKRNDIRPTQYTLRWTPIADGNPLEMANMFFDSLDCEWATPNFAIQGSFFNVIPNDTYFPNQYYLHNTGQEPIPGEGAGLSDMDIDAPEVWEITKGSPDIVIAVIDAGVCSHPELPSSRILPGYDYAGYNQSIQGDPNNPISPSDNDPSPDGNEAHGMACAGIIAASHNSVGIAGIAPNCKILPVKIMDFLGSFPQEIDRVADAVDFAWLNGADVISGSWGYYTSNPNNPLYTPIRDALIDAISMGRDGLGTVCVFAAGNFANRLNSYVAFPANIPDVLAVGAIDKSGNIQSYSPHDADIDIVSLSGGLRFGSPGDYLLRGNIWSIEIPSQSGWNPGDYRIYSPYYYNAYESTPLPRGDNYPPGDYTARFGGTSAAAPQVSGVAALILSKYPHLTQSEVVSIIKNSAVDISLPVEDQGSGLLNAYNALSYLSGPPATPQNFQVTKYTGVYPYRPKLTWTANTELDLAGYRIERKINNESWSTPNFGGDNVSPDVTEFIDMEILIWKSSNNQTVYYRMQAFDTEGLYSAYTPVKSINFHIMLKPEAESQDSAVMICAIPREFELQQNYPNPFNSETIIKFGLPEDMEVSIKIFNIKGQVVRELCEKKFESGYHQLPWNGTNDRGALMPSGVYFCKIESDKYYEIRKMVLIR